ncbi:MAG: sugar phosphate isomerase/epimerase family protein [Solirubrobacteraceae bacterium]
MGEIELLALYWTVSGPVDVHVGREWSLFEWHERCAEAATVGFTGLGLWHADIEHQLERRTLREMKRIFDDAGLKYLEVEFLADFFVEPGDAARAASDARRTLLWDTAAAFDAHHVKVGNIPGTPCELGRLTEAFAELCEDAANHTRAQVAYEFMPFDVNVHDLETALELVRNAGAPNGGLAIDTWHMAKLGIAPADLRRLGPEHLTWVELCDGQLENMDDLVDETVNHRRLPGEGEFDITGYVEVCQEIGYRGPWGVEVLSAQLRSLPIEEEFQRAYETTVAQFHAGVTGDERSLR